MLICESGGFCEVRGAIYQRDEADLIEAGLNEDAGDLRSGLWEEFQAVRRDGDLVDLSRDRHGRAFVVIAGGSDIARGDIDGPDVRLRAKILLRAQSRPAAAVELGGAIIVMDIDPRG